MRSLFGSRCRGVVVGLMVLLMAFLALPRGVAACSGGPPGGARGKLTISEVVVVGQVTSMGFLGESGDHAAAARVTIRVDHVLKGDVPGVVSYVDRASFISWPGGVDHTPENATTAVEAGRVARSTPTWRVSTCSRSSRVPMMAP